MDKIKIERTWLQGSPVQVDNLMGNAFVGEAGAHEFLISGKDNAGNVVPITGTITGKFLSSTMTTFALSGYVAEGVASVTLPSECYGAPGQFVVSIFATNGSTTTCIYCGVGSIFRTSTAAIAYPTTTLPDLTLLINQLDDVIASFPADLTHLLGAIAPTFVDNLPFYAGQYVWNDQVLYRFTVDHPAGSWAGSADTVVAVIGTELNSTVRYTQQVLTDAQKTVARSNIDAADADDVTDLELTTVQVTPQTFDDNSKSQARSNIGAASSGDLNTLSGLVIQQGGYISDLNAAIGTVPTGETVEGQITDLKSAIDALNTVCFPLPSEQVRALTSLMDAPIGCQFAMRGSSILALEPDFPFYLIANGTYNIYVRPFGSDNQSRLVDIIYFSYKYHYRGYKAASASGLEWNDVSWNQVSTLQTDVGTLTNATASRFDRFLGKEQYTTKTSSGITYEWDSEKQAFHIYGTSTGNSLYNIYQVPVTPGETVYVYPSGLQRAIVDVYLRTGSTNVSSKSIGSADPLASIVIPDDVDNILVRFHVASGITIDGYANGLMSKAPLYSLEHANIVRSHEYIPNSFDANEITDNSCYAFSSGTTLVNFPGDFTGGGVIVTERAVNLIKQKICAFLNERNYPIEYTRNAVIKNGVAAWSSWAETSNAISSDIITGNVSGFRYCYKTSTTAAGITYEFNANRLAWHVYGTYTEGLAYYVLSDYRNTKVYPGQTLYINFDVQGSDDLRLQLFFYPADSTSSVSSTTLKPGARKVVVPDGAYRLLCRFNVNVAGDYDAYASVTITTRNHSRFQYQGVLEEPDVNNVGRDYEGYYLLTDSVTYENLPTAKNTGYLYVYVFDKWVMQIYYLLDASKMFVRRLSSSGVWNSWAEIVGGDTTVYNNTYQNTYQTLHYQNSLTATVSPQITTDTNQYLAASGDQTDRKADIETLLTQTGVCHLGPGDFYVSGIDMPNGAMLTGAGKSTRLILLGEQTDVGYAIHFGNECTVRDMTIMGSTNTLSHSVYNYVERHGILWEATYNVDQSDKKRGLVDGCDIRNFPGGGVTCYNTGYAVNSTIMVSNTYIRDCMVGINIPYWSEFNIFTSCHVRACYYGAVNNGGNNLFVSCNFSANILGMLCDNSEGQSPNNTHGSVVACIFDHEDSNEGIGIKMVGCKNGEVFSDCQLFFADIDIENCAGIQLNNFNTGRNVDIRVTEGEAGGLVVFNNWVFTDGGYTIASDYDKCKFVNCWTKNGNAVTGNT